MAQSTQSVSTAPNGNPRRRLWPVPVFLAGLLALTAAYLSRPIWLDPETYWLEFNLEALRSAVRNAEAADEWFEPAQDLVRRCEARNYRAGEAHFLAGTISLRLAQQAPPTQASSLFAQAQDHLEKANTLGVPAGDRPRLEYRLGVVLLRSGGDLRRAIDYLRANASVADDPAEAYGLLTQAYLNLPQPDLEAALAANQLLLESPTANDDVLVPARLLRGELLLRLHRHAEARKVLARITAGDARIVARARELTARSFQEEGEWERAAELWNQLLADPTRPPARPDLARYFLGQCHQQLDQLSEAEKCWRAVLNAPGEVGTAAAVRLAALLVDADRVDEGLKFYTQVLGQLQRPEDFQNSLLTVVEVRSLVESGCQALLAAKRFQAAHQLAILHFKLAEPTKAHLLLGHVAVAWGQNLLRESASTATQSDRLSSVALARQYLREGASAFEAVAMQAAASPETTNWLWQSAMAYSLAEDFERAVPLLERFVRTAASPERMGEAWFRLARGYQALKQERARDDAYLRCIEYPGPFACRACFELARLQIAARQFDDAEELLGDILKKKLDAVQQSVDEETEEQTLYTLGDLLFQRAKYAPAAERLQQALSRFPRNPNALQARSQLAACWWRMASEYLTLLGASERQAREAQEFYRDKHREALTKAVGHYRNLVATLKELQNSRPLSSSEADLLRRSSFLVADGLFFLGHYEEAATAYRQLSRQYEGTVHELIALRDLWTCFSQTRSVTHMQQTLLLLRLRLEQLQSQIQDWPEDWPPTRWAQWLNQAQDQQNDLLTGR